MIESPFLLEFGGLVALALVAACGGEVMGTGSGGATASGTDASKSASVGSTMTAGSTSSMGSAGDVTPPVIVFTAPADQASNVPVNVNVSATFDEGMNASTLTNNTFLLSQGASTVAGTVSYAGTVVTFDPTLNLLPNTQYTATVTTGATDVAGNALAAPKTWTFQTGTSSALGPAVVNLGTASHFVVLAKSGITTVPQSVLTGDVGVSPIDSTAMTGFSFTSDPSGTFATSTQITGKAFAADYASPTPSNLTVAVGNMQTAYTAAAGRPTPDFVDLAAGQIGGLTLVPGLYRWGTDLLITTDVTLAGGPDDVWIFQVGGGITEASGVKVLLSGGAVPKNVFWQAAGAVALDPGAHFEGILMAQTQISLATGASANGRLLSQTAVTLDHATVTQPAP